ncbi:hypothetical protein FHX49_002524 [Microbacterium endophyticum]|uniref:Tetracycline repressor TetR C-terminal domain-containing protein n=1 Tax=Microbacterium endophyticum TaxID=1526412 RepID=A0A7W4V4X9_9MICO|nr:hypothetical protein [Microbacterium endophyticum]NIK35746.1 hypothetical protein [Microbacterium endophyticum]
MLELLLRALHDLGLDASTAGRAVDLLLQFATASAVERAAHASADAQELSDLESTLVSARPERHPLLVEAGTTAFTTVLRGNATRGRSMSS